VKPTPPAQSAIRPRRPTPAYSPRNGSNGTGSLMSVGAEAKANTRILVVDDEHTLRESCANVLTLEGYDATISGRGDEALELLRRRAFDIVLLDLYMSQVDGLTLMRSALKSNPAALVIVMTGDPSIDSSIEALRQGAWDYLPKPFSAAHLQVLVGRAAHFVLTARNSQGAATDAEQSSTIGERLALLGSTPAFRKAIELARKVADTDASVFITGESGSGKELVAQFIHQQSRRAKRAFVPVNCAALPESLIESEMFGHRKGAFTGAMREKPGLIETANGGTLFFDELVDMPKTAQAKLLRVIQDGVVRRVGSEDTDAVVDVRFISATNGDPDAAIKRGDLREDLLYRLRVVPVHLPPLRERQEDIPLLADYFFSKFWRRRNVQGETPELTEGAMRRLCTHQWKGNVRELQNVIEHVAVLAEPGVAIRAEDLPLRSEPGAVTDADPRDYPAPATDECYHPARDRVIAQFETRYLEWLINRGGGNMSEAARIAGVDRTTLYRLMERHGVRRQPTAGLVNDRAPSGTPNAANEATA
jgi:DNA-binding NtrC family response regulator